MLRIGATSVLAAALLLGVPASAAADLTAFLGVSTTPTSRPARGVAIGIGVVIIGFEFEYSKISEEDAQAAPSLTTGVGNIVVMTPTHKLQLYGTTGAGLYRERWRDVSETHLARNIGGGAKIALFGPIRVRIDYRIFSLSGTPIVKRYQRVYGGVNLSF